VKGRCQGEALRELLAEGGPGVVERAWGQFREWASEEGYYHSQPVRACASVGNAAASFTPPQAVRACGLPELE